MEWFLFLITDSLQYCSVKQEQNLAMHLIGDELVNTQVPIEQQLQLQVERNIRMAASTGLVTAQTGPL
jgi:hypothetical protein